MPERPNLIGKVILVGAGPGDEGLLTLKGKAWIERADIVVYDHLVNASLTRFARKYAEIVYAGKKSGQYVLSQSAINALLVDKARAGKIVVRLKGGDPFIFGRGGEEAQALREAGIEFIVVPGVTSPVGVAAYAGIPLTHRDYSSSVSIITGSNEKDPDDLRIDWREFAQRSGTLVFLMGARKLRHIAENLIHHGKNPDTPVAVVQWGTTPRQKTWTGTLSAIIDIAQKENIQPPALTIVGNVVNLKEHVDWFERLPLFGKTIVVTRAEEQSENLAQLLWEQGAEALAFPVIQTFPPEDWGPLDRALDRLSGYHGLIFTSVNGVKHFVERLNEKGKDIRELKGLRIYAIGPKTANAVRDLGIRVDVVPDEFVAESLLQSLGAENVKGKRFLLPRAAVARETLPDTLRSLGAEIDVAPAYRTLPPATGGVELSARLRQREIAAVTFTASSTVNNFMQILGPEARSLLQGVAIACIGPITAKTAREHGLHVDVQPAQFTVENLVAALADFFAAKR